MFLAARGISALTLVVFTVGACAPAYRRHTATAEEVQADPIKTVGLDTIIEYVKLVDGDSLAFDEAGATYWMQSRVVVGTTAQGEAVEIDIAEVKRLGIKRKTEGAKATDALVIVLAFTAALFLLFLVMWNDAGRPYTHSSSPTSPRE